MAEVVHHFAHLFMRAFVCSYLFLGTSPGGLAAQVLTICTTEVQGGWWKFSAWKANWQGGLKRAVYTLLVVWAVTYAVCTVTTVYNDHQNMAGRWQAVVREKDELKNGLAVRDRYIQQLTEDNARLRTPTPKTSSTKKSTPPPISQECSGGNCAISVGQQGGLTAGQVNIDTRPHLVLTDDQQAAITEAMKPFAGRSAFILANGSTAELVEFGKRLTSALSGATIKSEFHTGLSMSGGGEAVPVLYMGFGDNDVDIAQALGKAIVDNKVLSIKQIGVHHYEGTSAIFQIHISPP